MEAILPDGWKRARGYAYATVTPAGRTVRVAGQVALRDGQGPVDPALDFGQQFEIALGNVVRVVQSAGAGATDIAMLRAYVTDTEAFNQAGPQVAAAWGTHLGKHFPAMTLVEVTRLLDANAMVEIEAEAVLSD